MPKRGSCGSVLPGCRLSKQYTRRSIHQPSVATLHAPAEMPTALSSVPRYADVASCSRRAYHRERSPILNPHSAGCTAEPNSPRLRALALFGRRLAERAERLVVAGVQKPTQNQKSPSKWESNRRPREGRGGSVISVFTASKSKRGSVSI